MEQKKIAAKGLPTGMTHVAILADSLGIVYYAVVADPITTLAHALAVTLGGLLHFLSSLGNR